MAIAACCLGGAQAFVVPIATAPSSSAAQQVCVNPFDQMTQTKTVSKITSVNNHMAEHQLQQHEHVADMFACLELQALPIAAAPWGSAATPALARLL